MWAPAGGEAYATLGQAGRDVQAMPFAARRVLIRRRAQSARKTSDLIKRQAQTAQLISSYRGRPHARLKFSTRP